MKRIIILGATSMIAEHCARIWASRGYKLYLVARNDTKLQTIASDMRVRGAEKVITFCTDLNDMESHDKLFDEADDKLGSIDIVLISHGTLSNQKSCERSVKETIAEIQTNSLSTISLLNLAANKLEAKENGTICAISSVAGDRGRASNYVYGSSKAMVSAYTSGLRQRLHKSNVAVVTVKPGFVDTPMTAEFKKGFLWVKPSTVAKKITRAIEKKNDEIYVPAFWWVIMAIIKNIPNSIFKRIKL